MTRKTETVGQMVARLGMTWERWKALPVSERDRIVLADEGKRAEPSVIMDLPAQDRLAALHAALGR